VIAFINGVGVDRIIGFEGLGNGHNFNTLELEARLLACGVLTRAKMINDRSGGRSRKDRGDREEEYDEDEEWN
jgi:hypothetical protein